MPKPPWTPAASSPEGDDADVVLSGRSRGIPPSAELQPAAEIVAALRAPASADELRGLHTALGAYRERFGMSPAAASARRTRLRLAAAAGVAAAALGGASIAAAAGGLPNSVQSLAHHLIGAPAPPSHSASSQHSARPSTADPTSPSAAATRATAEAIRLCAAYQQVRDRGPAAVRHSAAFARLVALAGGAAGVDELCSAAQHARTATPGAGHSDVAGAPGTSDPGRPTTFAPTNPPVTKVPPGSTRTHPAPVPPSNSAHSPTAPPSGGRHTGPGSSHARADPAPSPTGAPPATGGG
jgi:hypothetical protein